MRKKNKSKNAIKPEKKKKKTNRPVPDERFKFIGGLIITCFALCLIIAFISYLFCWKADMSIPDSSILSASGEAKNIVGKIGHYTAKMFISYGFGYGAFFIPLIFGVTGLQLLSDHKMRVWTLILKFSIAVILVSLILSYFFKDAGGYLISGPGGAQGFHIINRLNALIGKTGTAVLLILLTVSYLIFALKVKISTFKSVTKIPVPKKKKKTTENGNDNPNTDNPNTDDEDTDGSNAPADGNTNTNSDIPFQIDVPKDGDDNDHKPIVNDIDEQSDEQPDADNIDEETPENTDNQLDISINRPVHNESLTPEEIQRLNEKYDPLLELSHYKFPPIELLKEYKPNNSFDNSEVHENKDQIIKTLSDFNISIRQISATVGPTVTLYEVVPDRGVKLTRIKSLEDDIALNLKALGIRIIAPIPGRGTVGIEVPNKKPEIVSMRSLISCKAFQETKFDIPLALGRTITNEPYIVDLTKMPHLLVAGATGQGKSVGINAIIASILYKKHPNEIKFVLIDPKRVELSLYTKIERHYLAKLPDEEDAIITDTQKVINTLNSLCIEMDRRLELLKNAHVRNLKEYNEKFVARKLNPEKGHEYLPYIVLIIDEFADLIMTAGREIESPIGRLAQLARAIGIHLIISTQRPSANIITGFIKANFPTRIAFRVFSTIDSRTILDISGADKLVGRGDMLISAGKEPIRLQCAFVDTDEIEKITEYIGNQQGYPTAMLLPEYYDEKQNGNAEVDLNRRDPLFDDAARLIVQSQQGSTSFIQRKLSIGYNRAGRIIDQLEAAHIVGPKENNNNKTREVYVTDPIALEQILKDLL